MTTVVAPQDSTRQYGRRGVQPRPVWEVMVDPSEGQMFLGRLFRSIDLTQGGGFAPGTVFQHIRTGERRRVVYRSTEKIQ